MAQGRNKKSLTKKVRKGDKGYPLVTVAYYGPDNSRASKIVCSLIRYEDADIESMQKWFSDGDARKSEKILGEVLSFIENNAAKSVVMIDKIIGCPHEQGIDYLEGEFCPECHYWKNRDRFTDELIH